MTEKSAFFYRDFEQYVEKDAAKHLKPDAAPVLQALIDGFAGLGDWSAEPLHAVSMCTHTEDNQHLAGRPAVIALHSSFLAVATSRGLILIFDRQQQLKITLAQVADAVADGAAAHDAVTALAFSTESELLVAGHASGRLVLWDVMTGQTLKVVEGAHEAAVRHLCFFHETRPYVFSADATGAAHLPDRKSVV